MKKRGFVFLILSLFSIAVLAGFQRLVVPKYMGQVVEGNFTAEYYRETTPHQVLFLGNCEAYENLSPVVLFREYGITSYIRGNANQLMPQSYYLLEYTLRMETPVAVVLNISSMKEAVQENESYNRMTMDGMRWSSSKWKAIEATKTEGEHMVEYLFPVLRFHSRIKELEADDFTYFWERGTVSHNGFYMRADVRPAGEFPAERRLSDYSFSEQNWEYLDRIRALCEERGITLILMKSPALYPAWHSQWEEQIVSYAEEHDLTYLNCMNHLDEIGIDFSQDTYDGGLHMNVYGAEKMARYFGELLKEIPGITDGRTDPELLAVWEEKGRFYDSMKTAQETEFAERGYLSQFTEAEPSSDGS